MSKEHLSFNSEFGISISEKGLNRLSAGLRSSKPELFSFRTEIPIIKPEADNPGHTLVLYAVLDEPLSFNLYPVVGNVDIDKDALFTSANILFSLTDSKLGSITRIRIKAESAVGITRSGKQLSLKLLKNSDGEPWFEIVSIEGEHAVLEGTDVHVNLNEMIRGDEETAGSFRAIMNYLISLFLKEGLLKTVQEFPLPPLEDLVEAGPLGKLPGRDIFIRNDAIYLTMGNQLLGDGNFPSKGPSMDLSVGVAEKGLQRILDKMSPMPVPIDVGSNATTLRLRSNNFRVSKIKANLLAGDSKFKCSVFFGGTLGLRLQFKAFGKWVRTPYLPLPIDASLSRYAGYILPFLEESNGAVQLKLRPDTKFLEAWYLLVVTDYRSLFKNLMRQLVDSVKSRLVHRVFRKIPIIGWILDKVLDITGDVIAWALGSVLDVFMSSFLTGIINTIGRVALQFMDRPDFQVFSIEQKKIKEFTGQEIAGSSVRQVNDGRGGELQVGFSLSEGTIPSPPPPVPTPPDFEPEPIPDLPSPSLPTLPEFPISQYSPPFVFFESDVISVKEKYFVNINESALSAEGFVEVEYAETDNGFSIIKETFLEDGDSPSSKVIGAYDKNGNLVRIEYVYGTSPENLSEIRHSISFEKAGYAIVSYSAENGETFETEIETKGISQIAADELWIFHLSRTSLSQSREGKFGRIEISNPLEFENWARLVPVSIEVADPEANGTQTNVNIVSNDLDGKIVAQISSEKGLLRADIETPIGSMSLIRQS